MWMDEIKTSEIQQPVTIFTGYDSLQEKAQLLFYKEVEEGCVLVFDKTPFFARGGGQVADLGTIDGAEVLDVRDWDGFYLHVVNSKKAYQVGEVLELIVDKEMRKRISILHSLTHVYWGEIENILNSKCDQTYELITHEDSTIEMVTIDEQFITQEILDQAIEKVKQDIALAIPSRIYLEDNKPDKRAVTWENVSFDYCVGTHVLNTSELKPPIILKFKKKANKHRIKFTF
ncbi:hypothetical protein ELUMI_v1c01820 [Williamsoniiplasma luminosum]|uniref:Alanyl-tRNA synthetase class IIc N-terminal domain-containing protein n=2 Tax=Williamsoniiplasma luminosum TaxID=214888 RepID=A0A2K8NT06_9MOLU|nr:hypothetical protein ELUMI_v1c01820 [Williamsoniiplasma luminosum]